MENFKPLPAWLLGRWGRIGFWFRKPVGQVERACRRNRTCQTESVTEILFSWELDVLHHWNILTWPSYPAVSASANTCIATLPRPTGPTSVVQSGRPRNWHRATIAAGPLWGDASESIFINPSDAWHALHLLDTKGELGVSGWKARLICLRTTESKSSWLTWKGKGSGSEESFWRKGMRKLGQIQYEHVRVESCPDWWGQAERWNPEFLY